MREVDSNTFFTNTKSIVLDSIYFQAGSRVQCAARAVNAKGDVGLELSSSIYTINREEGKVEDASYEFNQIKLVLSRETTVCS